MKEKRRRRYVLYFSTPPFFAPPSPHPATHTARTMDLLHASSDESVMLSTCECEEVTTDDIEKGAADVPANPAAAAAAAGATVEGAVHQLPANS